MPEPTIIQSTHWAAAVRPDGGHQTFEEALAALRSTGVQFDPSEISQHGVIEHQPGVFRLCPAEQEGALLAWVLPQ